MRISKTLHIIGDRPEQGNLAKLAANFMISSMIETFSEAGSLLNLFGQPCRLSSPLNQKRV
jgi:3-hydroxyisobutyrate dehydrogenase-like beta-hydroxyacid dehydrogenase